MCSRCSRSPVGLSGPPFVDGDGGLEQENVLFETPPLTPDRIVDEGSSAESSPFLWPLTASDLGSPRSSMSLKKHRSLPTGNSAPNRPPLAPGNLNSLLGPTRGRSGSFKYSSRAADEGSCVPETRFSSFTVAKAGGEEMVKTRYLSGTASGSDSWSTPFLSLGRNPQPRNRLGADPVLGSSLLLGDGDPEQAQVREDVICFMPTGIVVDVKIHPDDIIFNIKQIVLNVATSSESLPLRGCLNPDWKKYSVSYVGQRGVREQVFDETKTLRELKPFRNILKFSYRARSSESADFERYIGKLIGKDLNEYKAIQSCEVNDFRWKMKAFANGLAQARRRRLESSWRDRISYQYPPKLVPVSLKCLEFVRNEAVDDEGRCFYVSLGWNGTKERVRVDYETTADELVEGLGRKLGFRSAKCCFKAVGEDAYILGAHRMIEFSFVYERLRVGDVPRLVIVREDSVDVERVGDSIYLWLEKEGRHRQSPKSAAAASASSPPLLPVVLSADVDEPFRVHVETIGLAADFSLPASSRIGVRIGVYHGQKALCPTVAHIVGGGGAAGVVDVQKSFEFELRVSDMPRMAKLCVGVFERKRGGAATPLFWVNAQVFDYKSAVRWRDTLKMWRFSLGGVMPTHESALAPLQRSVCNPDVRDASDIVVCFANGGAPFEFAVRQRRIEFPSPDVDDGDGGCFLSDAAADSSGSDGDSVSSFASGSSSGFNSSGGIASKMYGQELASIADRDPLHELTVQEKDLIWKLRDYCCARLPHLLPRVVDCVDYSDPCQVSELHSLLARWPALPVERALQLLDHSYPDQSLRRFAVGCLRRNAADSDVLLYLMQLVQALKHEAYLFSDLMEFLLERALGNQHVGHFLFWELRPETSRSSSSVGLLCGLVLEAYLAAAPEHTRILGHQSKLLEKCKATAADSSRSGGGGYERARVRFAAALRNQFNGCHPYRNFVNPLDPNQKCRRLRASRSRLMNSKMRPQMLVFENADVARDVFVMFKKGDDLRQDRLTLQLLSVMDRLWKEAGMDLRMKIYRCVATDRDEGLIDAVQDAETICKIQMGSSSSSSSVKAAFRRGLLLGWLKARNGGPEAMANAQEQFTLSCAGYSVAAYVLGIGDRHNDNIMVKTNGQMFHIDFGHILGNFKHKFGIRRERVPMILSSEFVDVIKTAEFGRARNFERFRNLCERAFLALRRNAHLLISLLGMMVSTGLPELSSEQDLNVVRSTLLLDRTEEEALDNFRREFDESLRNAWKISLDWWFHMMNQARTSSSPK